ncbi:MAG: hypothetical protein IJL85_04520 [Erysipelotrichaceae bacterium]|nr:hypothetical protein [Erysipelotrichaceae bacterium]
MEKGTGIIAIFVYLMLLIMITRFSKRAKINKDNTDTPERYRKELDPDDENALVASLVAAIDYREETKKNIRIVSVRGVE